MFDIDGTLVDSNDFHVEAWQCVFADAGHDITRDRIHGQIGKGGDQLVPALLPDLDEQAVDALCDRHGALFKREYIAQVEPFPHARDLVARVHDDGMQVVLASSASGDELDHYVDLMDLKPLMTAATASDDVDRTKPAPDIFAAALAELPDLGAGDAVVIGDTPYDMRAAKRCGIARIAVRSGGFSDGTLREAGADAIHDDLATLLREYDRSMLGVGRG
ncbi:HAD family hydrolase [Stakelama sp. CBK3Z-3]|uniref:HAD family hydrolase n=1 Tax=Stakelama flava TaxID=2860338 RepID=A0ABS6XMW8_9SPHN|nr:HAD family hydrolase [Stakelama flava]MBW4331123.1 HAD family hydrolase [Stakelama flava]